MIDFTTIDDASLARHVEANRRVPWLAPALVAEQADDVVTAFQWATHEQGQARTVRVRVRCKVCFVDLAEVIDHGRVHEGRMRAALVPGRGDLGLAFFTGLIRCEDPTMRRGLNADALDMADIGDGVGGAPYAIDDARWSTWKEEHSGRIAVTTRYTACPEAVSARPLPSHLPLWCEGHGRRTVGRSEIAGALDRARRSGEVKPLRA